MIRLTFYFIAVLILFTGISYSQDEPVRLIAITMYADWCGSCKVLDPKVDAVKKEFKGKGVFFTQFDFTDDFTTEQSAHYASLVGLENLYSEHAGKTGYMLLIKPETKEVVSRITRDNSEEEIKQTILNAL